MWKKAQTEQTRPTDNTGINMT